MGLRSQVQRLSAVAAAHPGDSDLGGSRYCRLALLMMSASGFAGLGYQIVWTQQSALWLGHEAAAVLAVVSAFFGGLATGALWFGRRIDSSLRPAFWYACCELVIGFWAMLLVVMVAPFGTWVLRAIGILPDPLWQWTVAFGGTFVLLLPATTAMGATLPAMQRMSVLWRESGWSIAPLYASNTLGAVVGVLVTAFWLIPGLGLARTVAICIALNLLCALAALVLFRDAALTLRPVTARTANRSRQTLARLAGTGLLGIGYEVLVVRVLGQVAEDTVYTFAMLLAVYLSGCAAGAAAYPRLARRVSNRLVLRNRLLLALAAACVIGAASLWGADQLKLLALQRLGHSMAAAIASEAVLALVSFGPPTVVMGALFCHLVGDAKAAGVSFGSALGANTLGAAAAPLAFGVLAFPILGAKLALLLVVAGYLLMVSWRILNSSARWASASALAMLAAVAPPLAFIDVPAGGHIVSYQEGIMSAVSVVEDGNGVARLRIDNRQQEGSSSSLRVDARLALLPLLLHPGPHHALFLGLGTGMTAASAAEFSGLEVDAVELLPEVISASSYFTRSLSGNIPNSHLHLVHADARRYVRASERHYAVIVADNFHPARSGSGALYTIEHFAAVRNRLAADGLFCQWLPLHQLDLPTLRSVVAAFLSVYPHAWAMLASNSLETPVIGLIGRRDARVFDAGALSKPSRRLPAKLSGIGIDDELALFGGFIAGPVALRQFAGDAAVNTDDLPIVAYRAPRITYAPDSSPRDRLSALLQQLSIAPEELLIGGADRGWIRRLVAYWAARDRFVAFGRDVRPLSDVHQMLSQVRAPLLSVLQTSPDFRPAYDPLLLMAAALANTDVDGARALLQQLITAAPGRPEAQLALRSLNRQSQ